MTEKNTEKLTAERVGARQKRLSQRIRMQRSDQLNRKYKRIIIRSRAFL